MSTHITFSTVAFATGVAMATLVSACGGDDDSSSGGTSQDSSTTTETAAEPVIDPGDGGNYNPDLDPASFVTGVDNPYFPLPVGARWVYDGNDDGDQEHIEVTVTDERKEVLGIPVVVVRDTVELEGEFDNLVVTRDWNPLEPDVVEEKSYAEGVGVVLEEKVEGGEGRIELTEF